MKLIFILGILITMSGVCSAGNYLDNYFCTNEICNVYWQDCEPDDISLYCTARSQFLTCVGNISLLNGQNQRNQEYINCRAPISYETAGNFFYFLNCQINCGYQSLWLSCGQQLNLISGCPSNCPFQANDYSLWNSVYTNCITTQNTQQCGSIYFDPTLPLTEVDCQNSVKSKCKTFAAKQLGASNKYVQLLYCKSFSVIISFSLAALTLMFI